MPRWVDFREARSPQTNRRTKVFVVETCYDAPTELGHVKFYPRWRAFAFFPRAETLYEKQCLHAIADFCDAQTRAWREGLGKGHG